VATALGVTGLLAPVHLAVVVGFLLATESYDDSGVGGPFRACTADSVSCSGPNPWVMLLCALAFTGCLALAGVLGQVVGRFPRPGWARVALAAGSLAALAVVVLIGR